MVKHGEKRFQIARKQTRLLISEKNLRKSHFTVCHVTKYCTIIEVLSGSLVFAQPAVFKAEKALGTRLKILKPNFLEFDMFCIDDFFLFYPSLFVYLFRTIRLRCRTVMSPVQLPMF